MRSRPFLVTLLLLAGLTGAGNAQAVNTDRAGLALSGYDPVAYQVSQQATKGSSDFTATHEGATYRFLSAENRDAFLSDPVRYLPAYGGFCAYGMAKGYRAKIDPQAFTVIDGRLYLNYSKGVRDRWLKDVPGYLASADGNWARIKDIRED